jgi:succinate-semialdehyde dehydrogenase/glutarate-semialdehyde dehydrogenase
MKQCADTLKNVSLELGGNAPFIVFDDADLDNAVSDLVALKFRNAGQTCICANRILVQDTIYNEFVRRVVTRADNLRLGDGMQEDVDLGPLINSQAKGKVKELVDDAVAQGAIVVSGNGNIGHEDVFVQPTVLAEVDRHMLVCREEIFGPVAPLLKFKTEKDAVRIANDTEQGLAAYLYTRDINRIFRLSEALEFGMVGVNENAIATEVAPFGGVKQSGIGREGSRYGVDEYLEIKYLCLGDLDR